MEAPPDDVDLWLTTQEAIDELGISLSTLNRLCKRKEIEPIKKLPGKRGARLFSRNDIERLKTRRAAA